MYFRKPLLGVYKDSEETIGYSLSDNLFYYSFFSCVCLLGFAQDKDYQKESLPTTKQQDTTSAHKDAPKISDSLATKSDSLKPKKDSALKHKLKYKAKGYVKMNQKTSEIFLYDEAEVQYGDNELKAGVIKINYKDQEIYAGRIKDSTNKYTQTPNFKSGKEVIQPDSIRTNYHTKKTLVWNSRTKQDNGTYVKSKYLKKINDSVYYIKDAKITTSEDIDNPEYYFRVQKAKMIPGKRIIVGPTNMYIAEVPTPIGVPFAFFPTVNRRSSGIIIPTFGNGGNRGYFLQNGGYYLALSDYFDLALTGDYYSNASFGIRGNSRYTVRYRFDGNVNFRYENLVSSERGLPDYAKTSIYNIQWTHAPSSKANPNSRLSASVNLGSSNYYRQSINQLNTPNFLNNTLSSSISYSRTFQTKPGVSVSLNGSHTQNTNTKQHEMTLPNFQLTMDRVFPFEPKNGPKKNFIHNLNFQYTGNLQNQLRTVDSLFFTSKMFDNSKFGMRHSIPISTNMKVLKHFSLSLGTNYDEVWQLKTVKKHDYDTKTQKATQDTINGFDRFSTYNFSSSLGTTIYGMLTFKKGSKIQAIRHTMRPAVSFGYTPSFKQYYDNYVSNAAGTVTDYSRFEIGPFGTPSKMASGSVGFSLGNNLEAKVKDKDTTKLEAKKIMILNTLNFGTSYNILADSLKLSPVSVSGSTSIFKQKLSVNFGANLDPYAISANGVRINTLNIENGGSLFRLTNANVALSYSFSSKDMSGKDKNETGDNTASGGRNDDLFGKSMNFGQIGRNAQDSKEKSAKDEDKPYYFYKIPWDIRLSQTIQYSNVNRESTLQTGSLMFSGNVKPAPRWSVGFSSGYDFVQRGFTYTQINFQRDLKSWTMSFSWTPMGPNSTWFFFIGIKSGMFSDIKWEQRKSPDRTL